MATRRAFLLNLDADLELATSGASYTPSRAIERATEAHARVLARTLVPAGGVVIDPDTPPGSLEGYVAYAFSPTPRALARIRETGAEPALCVPADVLRTVSRRDFGYVHELEGARVHTDMEEALAHVRETRVIEHRLKRVFGMAGRGHRVVRGALTTADEAFVRASAPALIVEPNVWIVRELSLHGFLYADGRVAHGRACESRSSTRGAWQSTQRAELTGEVTTRLHVALERAGAALRAAGYRGPFGIDAFEHEHGGVRALRTQSEINARYSMGWAIGFAPERPDLE